MPRRVATIQRLHDDRHVLPGLQQRHADDERGWHSDLHVHGDDDFAAGGNQVPFPTGTITGVEILIDVQGTANVTNITVNGETQVPTTQAAKDQCKNGGWQNFTSPSFKNQGDCVSFFATGGKNSANG